MQVLDVEYLGAQARAHRNVDIGEVDLLALRSLGHHAIVVFQTGLVLGLASFGDERTHSSSFCMRLASFASRWPWAVIRAALVSRYVE